MAEDFAARMRTPCRCDPLGSGEEYCNGGCRLYARIDALTASLRELVEATSAYSALRFPEPEDLLRTADRLDAALAQARALVDEED